MIKILTIVGARPQFIKAAIFSKTVQSYEEIEEVIVHTGQHYDTNMSQIFFDQLNIPKPKYNLQINGGSHGEQTGKMIIEIEQILLQEKPHHVLVYGDTNSTLAGALAASKLNISVIHVEAGFRSHDKTMPEEINRLCTDHVSNYLFCPTKQTVEELAKEGITKNVYFVGDITYDATLEFSKYAQKENMYGDYIFCTVHRQANTDDKTALKNIFDALVQYGMKVIFPIHPRTKNKLLEYNLWNYYQDRNILFIEPIDYFQTIGLIRDAQMIVTDSGGILRESYYLKKKCIVLRDTIEFIEAVHAGEISLAGTSQTKLLELMYTFQPKGQFHPFFGNGAACKQIVEVLLNANM